MKIEQQTINGGNQQFSDKIENYEGDKKVSESTRKIKAKVYVEGDVKDGGQVAGDNIINKKSANNAEVNVLLEQLLAEIKLLNGKVPEQTIQTLNEESETLITEAIKEQPRKKYLGLSLEGIKEAALALKEIGEPVLEIATKLSPLLGI